MKLLGERILVKKVDKDSKIILPDHVMTDEIIEGEVVAIGNRVNLLGQHNATHGCDELELGDVVQWNAHGGMWTKIEGEVVCILRPNDVICVLEQAPFDVLNLVKN